MDPAEIARLVEELKLSNEAKENQVELSPNLAAITHERANKCLVGKIFAARVVNREALRSQLPKILQAHRDLEVEIVGDNIFVVSFSSQSERRNALLNGPWHFSNSLMLFKEVHGLQKPSEVCFDTFSTWVQLHNLPIVCMNPAVVREIGEKLGKVDEIDLGENGNCVGMYARVRVSRPIDSPLRRCVSLSTGNLSEPALILLRYERLPDFCFACGRVGHTIRFCNDDMANKIDPQFGIWLRAGRTQEVRRTRFTGQVDAHSSATPPSQPAGHGISEVQSKGRDSRSSEEFLSKGTDNSKENVNNRHLLIQNQDTGREVQYSLNEKRTEEDMPGSNRATSPMELSNSQDKCATPTRTRQSPGQIWKRRARSGKSIGRATESPLSSSSKRKASPEREELQSSKLARRVLPGDIRTGDEYDDAQQTAAAAKQPRRHQ